MHTYEEDTNLVAMWLRRDPTRWIAGILGGVFAGAVALGLAMIFSAASGGDVWFPAKLIATLWCGPAATEFAAGSGTIIAGVLTWEAICVFFGFIYAHFTGTNALHKLLPMGLVWAAFSWVFIWNLFLQSFSSIRYAHVSSGPMFAVCIAYGISLTSVSFFDRAFRGGRA